MFTETVVITAEDIEKLWGHKFVKEKKSKMDKELNEIKKKFEKVIC